jgi:hypothetical protein
VTGEGYISPLFGIAKSEPRILTPFCVCDARHHFGSYGHLLVFEHEFAVGGGDFDVVAGFEIADENFGGEGI